MIKKSILSDSGKGGGMSNDANLQQLFLIETNSPISNEWTSKFM